MLRFSVLLLLLSLAIVAHAKESRIESAGLSVLGIQPGSTLTLDDVVTRLGPGEQWHSGDASESEDKLCYRIPQIGGDEIIVFSSSGEMAASEGQVNTIHLYGQGNAYSDAARCSKLTGTAARLVTANGLALGMEKKVIQARFGKGKELDRDTLEYGSCKPRYFSRTDPAYKLWVGKSECFKNPAHPYYDDCVFIRVRFKTGKSIEITLSVVQSVC